VADALPRFDSVRNQRVAKYAGGTTTRVTSASCQLRMKIASTEPKNSNTFCTIEVRPDCTSSWSASTSDVSRETRRPVCSRS